jgi:hypothetical protein
MGGHRVTPAQGCGGDAGATLAGDKFLLNAGAWPRSPMSHRPAGRGTPAEL